MRLISLLGNSQKLDGGAMFGNIPKALWAKWIVPDELNRITLACRCLLIDTGKQKILLETGIGSFFAPTYKNRYGVVQSEHVLLNSLKKINLDHQDIDIIILSHLHFDHAGGLLSSWQENQDYKLLFPNAKYLISQTAWERALNPHYRDRASFIPELMELLVKSQRVILQNPKDNYNTLLGENFKFWYSDGHTPGMLLTEISTPDGPLIFAADLIPGLAWIHLPVTMGYDRYPEKLIDEKNILLNYISAQHGRLFFTHDPEIAAAEITQDINHQEKFIYTKTYKDLI